MLIKLQDYRARNPVEITPENINGVFIGTVETSYGNMLSLSIFINSPKFMHSKLAQVSYHPAQVVEIFDSPELRMSRMEQLQYLMNRDKEHEGRSILRSSI